MKYNDKKLNFFKGWVIHIVNPQRTILESVPECVHMHKYNVLYSNMLLIIYFQITMKTLFILSFKTWGEDTIRN